MGRLIAIDFGRKRCGVAATDPLRIVASGLQTVPTAEIVDFILKYIAENDVDAVVFGEPRDLKGNPSESQRFIIPSLNALRKRLPQNIPLIPYDERFTSALAHQAMIQGGLPKKARQNKELVDEMSATIILNDFLQSKFSSQV